MDKPEKARDWARNYHACLSPESKLGALRGAYRDGVLKETLKALKIITPVELVEDLHQGGAIPHGERAGEAA